MFQDSHFDTVASSELVCLVNDDDKLSMKAEWLPIVILCSNHDANERDFSSIIPMAKS